MVSCKIIYVNNCDPFYLQRNSFPLTFLHWPGFYSEWPDFFFGPVSFIVTRSQLKKSGHKNAVTTKKIGSLFRKTRSLLKKPVNSKKKRRYFRSIFELRKEKSINSSLWRVEGTFSVKLDFWNLVPLILFIP